MEVAFTDLLTPSSIPSVLNSGTPNVAAQIFANLMPRLPVLGMLPSGFPGRTLIIDKSLAIATVSIDNPLFTAPEQAIIQTFIDNYEATAAVRQKSSLLFLLDIKTVIGTTNVSRLYYGPKGNGIVPYPNVVGPVAAAASQILLRRTVGGEPSDLKLLTAQTFTSATTLSIQLSGFVAYSPS